MAICIELKKSDAILIFNSLYEILIFFFGF